MSGEAASIAERISANLAHVRQRMAQAARRAGRQPSEIKLVGVTKYADPTLARRLVLAGLNELGESRPQELWAKARALADLPVNWHLVGHLQRNKVRRTLPLVAMIHSVDSLALAEEIDREAAKADLRVNVLLEVNISGEATKHGFGPQQVEPILPQLAALSRIRVLGLMTIAGLEGGQERARRDFAALRELRDRLRPNCPAGVSLNELSMGMSGDFEVAIEEGATIVRVGSALFEVNRDLPVK